MGIPYDMFVSSFVSKVSEYEFLALEEEDRTKMIDSFMIRAILGFGSVCEYDLLASANDETREFEVDIPARDMYEIVEVVSSGMLVEWMKPYVYKQELLENVLNTRDFTTYSPAELLHRVGDAYAKAQKDFVGMVREYSYRHGDLTELHT